MILKNIIDINFPEGNSSSTNVVAEAGHGGLNGTGGSQGVVTGSNDLWGNTGSNHSAHNLFDNTWNSMYHGDTVANDEKWVQFEFPTAEKIYYYSVWHNHGRPNIGPRLRNARPWN